jgi:hypothetical protein
MHIRHHRLFPWLAAAALAGLIGSPAHAAGPRDILPEASTVKGWKTVGAPRLYNSGNLFDLIDGGAQAVLGYAFVACAYGQYAPAGQTKPALTIEVYDMTDPLNAFGLFGSDRSSGKPVPIGVEGVAIGSSGLNFWKGRYVVRTTILKVDPATTAAQMAFAKAAAEKIGGTWALPTILTALPPGGRQPRSEKYVRANVAGHEFLRNGVTARYPSYGMGAEVFICEYPSRAAAKAALDQFRAFEKSGAGLTALNGIGEVGFRVVDRYAKNVAVAQKGKHVLGVIRARDAAGALYLLKQAVARVK